jgi:uncharacterized membrane protein YuzA (DUF378 family)
MFGHCFLVGVPMQNLIRQILGNKPLNYTIYIYVCVCAYIYMYICNRVAAVNTKPNDDGKLRLKLCSHGQKLQTECSDGWPQTHLGHKKIHETTHNTEICDCKQSTCQTQPKSVEVMTDA